MVMTPGTYLRKRREADGKSIDDVAVLLPTEPKIPTIDRAEWLRQIEADIAPIGNDIVAALKQAFRFDAAILTRLDALRTKPGLIKPRLCRICACSDYVPCRVEPTLARPKSACGWVRGEDDLCSAHADERAVA